MKGVTLNEFLFPLYPCYLLVCVGDTIRACTEYIKNHTNIDTTYNLDICTDRTFGMTFSATAVHTKDKKKRLFTPSDIYIVICLTRTTSLDIISHEALHALNILYTLFDIQYSRTNDEPACYMMSWITRMCTSCIPKILKS